MKRVPTATKILAITGFANLLELYDFTLFAVLLPVLVTYFFPHGDYLIVGYLTFAVSFLIAPIGGIIWGYIGDKFGSSMIFKASLFVMAFPSLAISMLPTFEDAGWLAPILLIALRILQGFSASGEILASKIYAFDRLGQNKFLMSSSVVSAFGAIGVMLAVISGIYIAKSPGIDLWRIPFAIGGSLMFLMLLARMIVDKEITPKRHNIGALSVIKIIKQNPKAILGGFIASAILGIFSYFMHAFLINFQVSHLGHELSYAYETAKVGLMGTVVFAIITCILYKRQIKALMQASLLMSALLSVPLYMLLLLNIEWVTYVSLFLMGGLLGMFASVSGVYVITSFAHEDRCRGSLLVNAFGVAIFGGLTPLVMLMLAGVHVMLPGAALGISFIIGYLCICV